MSDVGNLGAEDWALLRAVIDRIVPADADPAATGFGADHYIEAQLKGDSAELLPLLRAGFAALQAAAVARLGTGFAAADAISQDALLAEVSDQLWFAELCELTAEGVYADPDNGGNPGAKSWDMVGYAHRLPEGPTGPPGRNGKPPRPLGDGLTDFDVIVVGAGAGGGVAAGVLAEAGKRVLLIERGVERTYGDSGHRDHVRNQWTAIHGHNTGPELEGNPRIAVALDGTEVIVPPHDARYQNNASAVGSGTVVYGMQAWRFHPDDFRMASRYGVPDGSSLTDWPIGYDDLAPWYEMAEWEIGVAGAGGTNRNEGARARDYPMPPVPTYGAAEVLRRGAERLGISTFSPPLLVNTVPRDGRDACIQCGTCAGFPCPSDAKNGTQNTMVKRALATGNCTLVTGAMVLRVTTNDRGRATGVVFTEATGAERTIRAKAVVLAGGAIETARLLLNSRSAREPDGLGNNNDIVGRNLQGHVYPTVNGLFDEEVHTSFGPGVTIATTDWNHGNDGVIAGAMIADDFVMYPVAMWRTGLPPDMPRWGRVPKDFMRREYHHVLKLKGPVHEVPNPQARVTLTDTVRDRWGLPVPRLSGAIHPETLRTANYMWDRAGEWLRASGAREIYGERPKLRLSAGQHQAGTCRMGTAPENSVTDSFGRVWGHDNLYVADSSVHPTNGGYNPVLTIMALAFRNATAIARAI